LLITLCVIFPISGLLTTGLQPAAHGEFSFRTWVAHSALVAFAVAITGTALSSAIGYALSRSRFLRHTSGLAGALLAQLLPVTILLLPILALLFWLGLLDTYGTLLVIYLLTALPFCIWQLKRAHSANPLALEEAAAIDGATPWQFLSRILLPLTLPALAITLIFSFLFAWNEYVIGALFLRNPALFATPPAAPIIRAPLGPDLTTALLIAVPALLVFLFLSHLLARGATGDKARKETN
jgi:arabinogalactan oligomer/maltooligosaccharide transport system permease protein